MNKLTVGLGFAVVAVVSVSAMAFAAGANLTSGSIGQLAGDMSNFGVAVCNNGSASQAAPVPVVVTANGVSASVQSNPSIGAGACSYTYLTYKSFNMTGGNSYNVQIAVSGQSAQSYSVVVPTGVVLGASTGPVDQNRINLMATEVQLLKQLISLVRGKLGL